VEKGSIAIDGVSLTVAYVDDRVFKVSVIPHTGEETTLLGRKPGDPVNLENDIVGKYVEKLMRVSGEQRVQGSRKSGCGNGG
jgi:riboflavin synthase